MGWVRTDDDFYDHPAWIGASCAEVGAWMLMKAWCNRNLSNGKVPEVVVPRLGIDDDTLAALAQRGRIHRNGSGWEIHDFLDYQPSREEVLAKRGELSVKRSEAGKKGAEARWHSDGKAMANASQDDGPNPNPNPKKEQRASSDAQRVFDAWRESTGKDRAVFDGKRKSIVKARLKEFPVEDLILAVQGWKNSPFHRGENDRQKVYNELELLLRNAAKVEEFRDLARDAPSDPDAWMRQ